MVRVQVQVEGDRESGRGGGLRFTIDGPQGEGTGDLAVDVLEQPGPPLALSWLVGLTPLALTLAFFAVVWMRTGLHSNADTIS